MAAIDVARHQSLQHIQLSYYLDDYTSDVINCKSAAERGAGFTLPSRRSGIPGWDSPETRRSW